MKSLLVDFGHRLLVVVGPSGAGKDSVIQAWLASLPIDKRPHWARRVITRPMHPQSEIHEAMAEDAFLTLAEQNAFAFAWRANSLYYGVRWEALQPLADSRWVIVNGSREHLPGLLRAAPAARIVAIDATPEALQKRLLARGREEESAVRERLARQPAPIDAHLRIDNSGSLDDAVRTLSAWWRTDPR